MNVRGGPSVNLVATGVRELRASQVLSKWELRGLGFGPLLGRAVHGRSDVEHGHVGMR